MSVRFCKTLAALPPVPGAYRHFPVFRTRWLVLRTLFFGALPLGLASGAVVCAGLGTGRWETALRAGGYFMGDLLLLLCAGPALATLARRCRLPLPAERVLVVTAVLAGIVLGWAVRGAWAGPGWNRQLGVAGPGPGGAFLAPAAGVAIDLLIGGVFALGAYFRERGRPTP